jgi:Ca-activated chloride channel family protein
MDSSSVHFANPLWLWGLAGLPLLPFLFFFASRSKRATLFLGNAPLVGAAPGALSVLAFPWILRMLVLALCLIAAARPQSGHKKVEEKKPVTDLFVAFDVSGSMQLQDLKPSRVEAAKKFLGEFLDQVQNVQVGIEVFARLPFTQCPMTTDTQVVHALLQNVEVGSVKMDGTAIGDALVACLNRLQKGSGQEGGASPPTGSVLSKLTGDNATPPEGNNHQAIILLTDGGDNASKITPLTAAKLAAREGVKIYAIGVGSLEPTLAIFKDANGKTSYFVDPNTGQIAKEDPVDMVLLRAIAQETGGKAYSATDNASLKTVLEDIARLEKRDSVTVTNWEYNELGAYFLLAAFLILALDMVLGLTLLRTLP